jgi:hypothetical protein
MVRKYLTETIRRNYYVKALCQIGQDKYKFQTILEEAWHAQAFPSQHGQALDLSGRKPQQLQRLYSY